MSSERRKLSNLVIDPGGLLRLSIPFLLMMGVSLGIIATISQKIMNALTSTELVGRENLAAMNSLLEVQRTVTKVGWTGSLILAAVCLGMWIYYSHRIFGPMVPLRRHVQHLTEGDFNSRVHLRKSDEFTALADDLNKLAESLAAKRK